MRYQVLGEGPPVVLVHGLSGSTLWWRRNTGKLAEHYRVYMVDLPGFGSMGFPRSRVQLKVAGKWLHGWTQALGLEKATFIGHSMGGYICLWLAARYPEQVERLVLVSPAVLPRVKNIFGYLLPLLQAIRYMTPDFFVILSYDALRAGPLTLLRAAQELVSQDVREEMEKVRVPTLLVWGENDTLVPPGIGQIVQAAIKGSQLRVLKNAAHVSMFDQAKEFNIAVLAFMQGEQVGKLRKQDSPTQVGVDR